MKFLTFLAIAFAFCFSSASAALIDIDGSVNTTSQNQGGEFANYSALALNADPIPTSTVNDGIVSLSVIDTGNPRWATGYASGYQYSNGAEINFNKGVTGNPNPTTLGEAVTNNAYLDLVISSVGFGGSLFDLNSISVELWRNGAGAATDYQFLFDGNANGFSASDALGTSTNVSDLVQPVPRPRPRFHTMPSRLPAV